MNMLPIISLFLMYGFFSSANFASDFSAEDFEKIKQAFSLTIEAAKNKEMSSEQITNIATMMGELGCALRAAQQPALEVKNLPPYVKKHSDIYSSPATESFNQKKRKALSRETPSSPMFKRQKKDETDVQKIDAMVKILEQEDSSILKEEITNVVYLISAFRTDYCQNYLDPENKIRADKVLEVITKLYPEADLVTKRKYLMLYYESSLRELIKNGTISIEACQYAGLAKDDERRAKEHNRDIGNTIKVAQQTKTKNFKAIKEAGYKLRENAVIGNLPDTNEMPIFEALLAYVIPVQVTGGVGKIADTKSHKFITEEYLNWPIRIENLTKLKLITVTEDKTENLYTKGCRSMLYLILCNLASYSYTVILKTLKFAVPAKANRHQLKGLAAE